jgi:hypothetical protein
MYALSVSVEGLRPWEYWQMDSEDYHMICELRAAWHEEQENERRNSIPDQADI